MDNLEKIERYLNGSMLSKEKKEFDTLLKNNTKLSAEVVLVKEINEAILDDEAEEFRQTLKKIINPDQESKPINKSLINALKIPLAASVIILVGLSLYNIFIHQDTSKLFSNFYKPYSTDISTRSAAKMKDNIQLSYYLYQEGDYESSYEMLKNYTIKNFDDQTARFYLGLNALQLQYYKMAIDEFTMVEQDTVSPFALHARWYLAMAYLKEGNIKSARHFLQKLTDEDNMYSYRARKILKKLKS